MFDKHNVRKIAARFAATHLQFANPECWDGAITNPEPDSFKTDATLHRIRNGLNLRIHFERLGTDFAPDWVHFCETVDIGNNKTIACQYGNSINDVEALTDTIMRLCGDML